jgi:hypothetical protein
MFDVVSFESYLQRRFTRSSANKETLICEPSDDVGLIHQYRLLQSELFISLSGGARPPIAPDDGYDDHSLFMVARKKKHCLGGCRITLKEPGDSTLLPLERAGFRLSSALRYLPLSSVRCAQISNMAAFPDRMNLISAALLGASLRQLVSHKVRFVFLTGASSQMREYAEAVNDSGFIATVAKISGGFLPGGDAMDETHLLVIDLASAYRNKNKEKQMVDDKDQILYQN